MERTASFGKTSPAASPSSSTAVVPSKDTPQAAPANTSAKNKNKDTLDARDDGRRWSLFSRGTAARTVPVLDENAYADQRNAFWDAMNQNNVAGVQAVLKNLNVLQRERLLRTPSPMVSATEWAPKLPLCRAVAAGLVGMTEALLQMHADPWTGDPWKSADVNDVKHPATTPAFWGVFYGKTAALRAIYKTTRSTLEARRALCFKVYPEVLTWLVDKGVTPEDLAPAMRAAIERDDAQAVRLLARDGKADVNATCSTSDEVATTSSLLAYAIAADKADAASVLVEFGARATDRKIDPAGKNTPQHENFPLTLAIRKGFVNLVTQILYARPRESLELRPNLPGMPPPPPPISDTAYLLAAFEAPCAVEMYMSLYRAGLQPKSLPEAEALLQKAEEKKLEYLYAFIGRQRTLLILDDEKKGNDAAKASVRAARDALADALSDNPAYVTPSNLTDHAQAMTLEPRMPGRTLLNVFNRFGKKKAAAAGNALANAAANAAAHAVPNVMGNQPLLLM